MSALNFDEIIAALQSSNESDRCYALEDLEQLGNPKMVPYLIAALEDQSVRVRETAVDVLARVGGSEVADKLALHLYSENVVLRNAAIEIFEKLGTVGLDALKQHIHSNSADVRKFAIDTVGKILMQTPEASKNIWQALVVHLSDDDVNVAAAAAEALGFIDDDCAIPFLLEHMSGAKKSSWLQCSIIVALSRIRSDKATEALHQIKSSDLFHEAQVFLEIALKGEIL